ncbi:MAG: pitrilysin family protein [Candidatus Sumerlaeota bacterium]|nr:pitrilysin family protein [Candidatus Sumerlaeota bacterium]
MVRSRRVRPHAAPRLPFLGGAPVLETPSPKVASHETPTGMKVFVQEMPGVRVATLDAWVNTGSGDEPPAFGGVSHFLEHMLFKGTAQYKPGDLDRLIEGLGGDLNAETSQDFTHFHLTVPSNKVNEAYGALADALANSTLDPQELEKERGVVLEEINRKDDNPVGLLFETIYQTAFRSGPYRGSVLGESKVIARLPRQKMLEYYRRRYSPQNTALFVVGDVEADEAFRRADAAFADFQRPLGFYDDAPRETVWNQGADLVIEKDVNEAYVAAVFPAPSVAQAQLTVACDVLQTALATGRASRLYRELKERRQIVTTIDASFPTAKQESVFAIYATMDPGRIGEFRSALESELDRVRREKLTDEELLRAKRVLAREVEFSKETTEDAASVLGYYYTLTGSLDFEAQYPQAIQSVTARQVREAARRVFAPAQVVWVAIQPKPAPKPAASAPSPGA